MYRDRRANTRPIPNSLNEYAAALEARPRYSQTVHGGQFYQGVCIDPTDVTSVAVVFMSPKLSDLLNMETTHIHVDATFKVVPTNPPCYQLMTVAVIMFDHAFPPGVGSYELQNGEFI